MLKVIEQFFGSEAASRKKNTLINLLGGFWLSAIVGFLALTVYDFKSGTAAAQPQSWPAQSQLKLASDRCTAIVFLHPQCPCSMATVTELSKVMEQCKGSLLVYAVALENKSPVANMATLGLPAFPESNRLLDHVAENPNIKLVADPGGTIAASFGAQTSGYVVLYSRTGALLFHGGITSSRSHEGDNAGADAFLLAVREPRYGTIASTPVFGCSLIENNQQDIVQEIAHEKSFNGSN